MKPPPGYTGHARDLLKAQTVADPNVKITDDVKLLTRTDGKTVIFDRRLPLGENAGVFLDADVAELEARKLYAHEIGVKKEGPAKFSASDEEAFAGMKRAAARGFAPHEPAFLVHDLEGPAPPPGVEDKRKGAIIGRCFRCGREGVGRNEECLPRSAPLTEDDATFVELEYEPATKPDRPALVADVIDDAIIAYEAGPDFRPCPRCDDGICALDCACACHLNDDIPPLGDE